MEKTESDGGCDELVQCEYHDVGCTVKVSRKRKREHEEENMIQHLAMTRAKLRQVQDELADTKINFEVTYDRLTNLEILIRRAIVEPGQDDRLQIESSWFTELAAAEELATFGTPKCPCIIKISEFDKLNEQVFHAPFYTHHKGYLMQLSVNVSAAMDDPNAAKDLLVQLCVMKGPHDDNLAWPLRATFDVTLLNQISDNSHCTDVVLFNDEVDRGDRIWDDKYHLEKCVCKRSIGYYPLVEEEDLNKVSPTCVFVRNNCIYIAIKCYRARVTL